VREAALIRYGPLISGLTTIGCVVGRAALDADAPASATATAAIRANPSRSLGVWSFCFITFLFLNVTSR
jgi:hypothetical protein